MQVPGRHSRQWVARAASAMLLLQPAGTPARDGGADGGDVREGPRPCSLRPENRLKTEKQRACLHLNFFGVKRKFFVELGPKN